MNQKVKKLVTLVMSICLMVSGISFIPNTVIAADTLLNVANNRNNYTFMTSNANTPVEGFLYVMKIWEMEITF